MPELTIRPPRMRFDPLTRAEKDAIAAMTADERLAAMCAGRFSYAECCFWAARWSGEVPLINGEFAFIAALTPEAAERSPTLAVTPEVAELAIAA